MPPLSDRRWLLLVALGVLAGCPDDDPWSMDDDDSSGVYVDCREFEDPWGDGEDTNCDDCPEGSPDGAGDGIDRDCDGYPANSDLAASYQHLYDCDGEDPAIHPEAPEVANDGIDQDCDGSDCTDADGDSFCAEIDDCDDEDPGAHPDAEEIANAVDDDCDDTVDEGTGAFDDDGDGSCEGADLYGNGDECSDGSVPGDCDDADPTLESLDVDGDGFDTCGGDCDDGRAHIHPGQEEICDGVDTDCDETTDELVDADGDGVTVCGGDCDDADVTRSPVAREVCDGVDNDCDAAVDEGCVTCDTTVPDDVATVAYAVAGSSEGDLICLRAGTYPGTVDFDGRAITLLGVSGATATVLDGAGVGPVVRFASGEGEGSVLQGVTVTGGSAENGGGIYITHSSPSLTSVMVRGNTASAAGGGIYISDGVPSLLAVTVQDNESGGRGGGIALVGAAPQLTGVSVMDNRAGSLGGGLSLEDSNGRFYQLTATGNEASIDGGGINMESSSPTIRGAILSRNVADAGGGLRITDSSAPLILDASVTENEAMQGAGIAVEGADPFLISAVVVGNVGDWGGGLIVEGGSPALTNAYFASNVATSSGGGAYLSDATPTFTSVVFAGNEADHGAGLFMAGSAPVGTNVAIVGNLATLSGGAATVYDSTWTLTNAVLTANESGGAGGGIKLLSGTAYLYYCDAWGNSPDDYSGMSDPTGSYGNLSVDPLLLNVSGVDPLEWDLHLDTSSPLVDAGDPGIQDPDSGTSDMGAYGGMGAEDWDRDDDGYEEWWQPGPYDAVYYPPMGYDCDDLDPTVHPGAGC